MEMFGIVSVAAITLLVYLACLAIRATNLDNKWLPCIAGILGVALGLVAYVTGMPEYPASDWITAAAVGAASGLAATGIDQIGKQLSK